MERILEIRLQRLLRRHELRARAMGAAKSNDDYEIERAKLLRSKTSILNLFNLLISNYEKEKNRGPKPH